jgi:inorganic pyrophosphatase
MGLIGKWIAVPEPDDSDYSQIGEITDVQENGDYLYPIVRVRNGGEGPAYSQIFSISDFAGALVFETEAELDRYLAWEPPAKILKFAK